MAASLRLPGAVRRAIPPPAPVLGSAQGLKPETPPGRNGMRVIQRVGSESLASSPSS